ncbi:MAG: hypothetical protein QM724_10310 [Flavobacteriales bacterium]
MLQSFYALLTDAHGTDAPIFVFTARDMAERVLQEQGFAYGEVVPFTCKDLLTGTVNGLIYLAVTLEDTGLRIQAAFRSMLGLRTFMEEHLGETPCVPTTAVLKIDQMIRE